MRSVKNMAGKNNIKFKMPKSLLPSANKIAKRGLYEIMWGVKPRNYEKRIKEGKYQKGEVSQSSIVTAERWNMLDIQKQINNVVAAMLTIAWASTKKRDISQDEISAVYKNFCGNK